MNQPIENAVGQRRIANLFVSARDRQLRSQDSGADLVAVLADLSRTVSWLASDLPFSERLLAVVMSSAAGLWKLFRDRAERGSGTGLKLFGFIAESAFTLIPGILFGLTPEYRSESSRNRVHLRSDSSGGFDLEFTPRNRCVT